MKPELETRPNLETSESLEYNFKEIAELGPAMTELVAQLKNAIENGEYDTLISDEVAGRIPTLVLRELIKRLNPDLKLNTFFINGGFALKGEYPEELVDFFEKISPKVKKALLVTEFIFKGKTIATFSDIMSSVNIDFDAASLFQYTTGDINRLREDLAASGNHRLYIGDNYSNAPGATKGHLDIDNMSQRLAGVAKKSEYSLHPFRLAEVYDEQGRRFTDEEFDEIFGITTDESPSSRREKHENPARIKLYKAKKEEKLSPEEIDEINKNIRLAREDVKKLAASITEKIWGQLP